MYLEYKKAQIGWALLPKLTNHLGSIEYKKEFIFLFDTCELVILDDEILNILDYLDIRYTITHPTNAVKFILDIK